MHVMQPNPLKSVIDNAKIFPPIPDNKNIAKVIKGPYVFSQLETIIIIAINYITK